MKPQFPTSHQQKSSLLYLAIGGISILAAGMGCSYSAHAATLYVAEGSNINKFAPNGTKTSFITTGLFSPRDLAVDLGGNLFVADLNSVFKYTPGGTQTTIATFTPGTNVSAIAVDATGNLFAADNSSIFKYTSGGTQTTFAALPNTNALAIDAGGNIFASTGSTIFKYTPGGVQSTFATGATPLNLDSNFTGLGAYSLAFGTSGPGKSGKLAALDGRFVNQGNLFAIIENFLPSGASRAFVGSGLDFNDVAVDENDNVFVSTKNGSIVKYTPGIGGASSFGGFSAPSAIAFDLSSPVSPTAVPEPFTIVGTLLGGTAAMRLRKKLTSSNKA